MIIHSKNAIILAILFLVPFVALSQEPVIKEASKGKFSDKIYVEWSFVANSVTLWRAESRRKVRNTTNLIYTRQGTYQTGEYKISDRDNLKVGYFYYYKIGDTVGDTANYGYIVAVAVADINVPIILSDTIRSFNQPLLKGEVEIARALNSNTKSVKLTIDKTTIELVNAIGGRIKIERSDREQTMSLGKPSFTKSKPIPFDTTANGVFVDKDVNDKVHLYKYQIIVFDKDGKEIAHSNSVTIDLTK